MATQRGEVYVWGLNNYRQLCTGDSKNRYQPELLEGGLIGGRDLGVGYGEEDGEQENSGCVSWWSAHSSSGLQ